MENEKWKMENGKWEGGKEGREIRELPVRINAIII